MSSHDEDRGADGVSRRKVLECMTWAGTGVLWTVCSPAVAFACLTTWMLLALAGLLVTAARRSA